MTRIFSWRASAGGRRVAQNVLFKAISVPIEKASRLLIMILAAPALGTARFGIYQFIAALTGMLALCAELGLGVWTTRALARARDDAARIVGTAMGVRVFTGGLYLTVIVGVALAAPTAEERTATLLLGAATIVNAFADYFGAVFRGFEDLRDEARLNIARALLIAAGGLGALLCDRSLTALSVGLLIGTCVSTGWGLLILRRRHPSVFPWRGQLEWPFARAALSQSAPIWLATLLSLLYFKADVVILRALGGEQALGAYSAAYRIFESVMLLPSIVMAAAFAPLARAHGDRHRQRRWERALMATLFGMGLLVAGTIYLASHRIVAAVFGADFSRAWGSLRILALGIPILFVNSGLRQFLIARSLERVNLWLSGGLLIFNVALNLAVIPRFRGEGAALATVATELVLAISAILAIRTSSGAWSGAAVVDQRGPS